MASARGVVCVSLRDKEYRLRATLDAVDELEARTAPLGAHLKAFEQAETVRFGWVRQMFIHFARGGGDPLEADLIADLDIGDMEELVGGVQKLLVEYGLLEAPAEDEPERATEGNADATETEDGPPSPPRGESGSE